MLLKRIIKLRSCTLKWLTGLNQPKLVLFYIKWAHSRTLLKGLWWLHLLLQYPWQNTCAVRIKILSNERVIWQPFFILKQRRLEIEHMKYRVRWIRKLWIPHSLQHSERRPIIKTSKKARACIHAFKDSLHLSIRTVVLIDSSKHACWGDNIYYLVWIGKPLC